MVEILLHNYDCVIKVVRYLYNYVGLGWQSGKTLDGWTDSVFLTLKTKKMENLNGIYETYYDNGQIRTDKNSLLLKSCCLQETDE